MCVEYIIIVKYIFLMDEPGGGGGGPQQQFNIGAATRILQDIKERAEKAITEQQQIKNEKQKRNAEINLFKSSVEEAAQLLDVMDHGQYWDALETELMEIMPQSCRVELSLPQGMPGIHDLPDKLKQEFLVAKQIVKSHELATVIEIEPTLLKFLQNRLRIIVGMCAAKILHDSGDTSNTAFKCIMTVNMSMRILHSPATYELLHKVFGPATEISPDKLNECVSTLERFADLACRAVVNTKVGFIDKLFVIVSRQFTPDNLALLTTTLVRFYVSGRLVDAVAPGTTRLLATFVGFGIPMVSLTVEM